MNARGLALILWLLPMAAWPQGFAGLGSQTEGFARPVRGHRLEFPADHGPHPDFRIEWWYLTANLRGPDGAPFGAQWTLFRSALAPGGQDPQGWDSPQQWMGNAAVTGTDWHHFSERLARGGVGQAGVVAEPFRAFVDDWVFEQNGQTFDLRASGSDFAYDLHLAGTGPVVLHGEAGYSVKSGAGQASYYYSMPGLEVSGTLWLRDGPVAVTGTAWFDHEWSSQPLAADQTGWDWFSLSFDSGDRLMAFWLRGAERFGSATWIGPDGQATPLTDAEIAARPLDWHQVAGRDVPTRWQVDVPSRGLDVTVQALNPDAWMGGRFPYWEGPVTVTGSRNGQGYLEMTGHE